MSIEFSVQSHSKYLEFVVTAEGYRISSGLLDENEAKEYAKELIYAAEKLLPAGTGDVEFRLYKAREDL